MSDLVARLRLTAADEGLSATATKAAQAVDQVGKSAASAKGQLDQASAGAKNADAGLRQLETGSKRAESGIRALAAALGIVELKAFEAQIRDAAFAMQGFETGLAAVTGGSANARSSIAFVREESARLGLVVRDQLGSFQSLAAATNGTALQGEQTRAIWLGMNEAGTALHLTQEKMNLAQMAVNQIASKGVVSMEELRQQLAESLPGSFQIASRAMGMSSSQFMQLVASGKLLSEDFLPKFAAELQNEFGPTVEKSLITPVGQARVALADLKNVAFDLETAAGQGFLSGIIGGISGLDSTLSSSQAADKAREIGTALGQLTGLGAQGLTAIIQNLDALEIAAGGALGVMTASKIGAIAGAWADARAATASAAAEARVLAAAHLEAAQATLAVARAQQTAMSSGLTYAERQAAVAVAVRGVAVAEAELAAATVAAGGAAVTAETALGGLLGLVGGPWGAAFLAAGAGVAYVTKALGEASVQQQEMAKRTRDATEALEGAKKILGELNLGDLGTQAQDDQKWIEALTGKVGALADELYRVASAKKTAAINDLMSADAGISQTLTDLQSRRAALTRPQTDPLTAARLGISAPDVDTTALDAEIAGQKARQSEIEGTILKLNQQPLDSFYDQPGHQALATKPNKADNRAAKSAVDLAEQIQSEKDYTAALLQGGQALDDWKVKDAGRQALEKVGLAEKPKLTAAEQALAATIRQRAEETERLKLANERLTKASDLARTADLETQALRDQAVAAMQGEQALEDYRVKQAGLQVLQQEGVQSLDQLTGKTLEQTKAAIASAEAKERQAIATEKAQKVGGELRDLDRRIASERAHTASLADGTKAEVDYARAEFERQEIERAGTNITAEQIEKIKTKADLLFRLQGAAEAASDKKAFEQDLKFAAMTADEREREQRALQLSAQIIKTNPSLSQAEADGLARVQAEWEQQQTLRANDIGQLRDSLRQTFIESGQLGFDDVGKYVEQRLRKAVYDALLAKPIDMVINAVVGSVTGLSGLGGSAAGGGDLLGIGGLLQSAVPGLGAASSLGGLLGSAGIGSLLGSAIGVKGTSSGAANAGLALGGSYLGSLAGTALIDAGSMGVGGALGGSALMGLGSIAGPLGALAAIAIGGLLGGSKPSNFMASASFGAGGSYVLGGDKPNANTTSAATSVATAIQGAIQALDKIGVQADGVISRIEIGQRDASVIQLANGQRLSTPVGDQKALTDAVSKALLQNAGYSDPQLKSLVDQMIAANSSFDQISRALQAASDAIGVFGDKIDQSVAAALLPQRAKMQAWLDSLDVGQTTTLNPMEQRGAAYADYSRVFGQAQSGDADAIANLSAYADRLLQADQQATSSAAERAAMEEMVKSQVAGLFALTRSDPLSPTFDLGEVAQAASQTVAGPVSAGAVAAPPGNSVAAAIQRMSDVLESRLSALQSAMATVDDTAHNGLSAVVDQLAQCVDLARQELNVAALTQQYVRYNPLGNAGR